MKFIGVIVTTWVVTLTAFAKRAPPPEVLPVKKNGVEYSLNVLPIHCKKNSDKACGKQVFLLASQSPSSENIWKTLLYERHYVTHLEHDVQDILPTSLKIEKTRLVVVDERGSRYVVESKDGTLIYPAKAVVYAPDPKKL